MEGFESKPSDLKFSSPNDGGWYWLDNLGKKSTDDIITILSDYTGTHAEQPNDDNDLYDEIINGVDNIINNDYPDSIGSDDGLSIGGEETVITRHTSHPYGFGSPPVRTFNDDPKIRNTNHTDILTYEAFKRNKYA